MRLALLSLPALTISFLLLLSLTFASSQPLSRAMIFLSYLKAAKDQALERHFNLLTGLWKAPPVRFGRHGTVNGVYLLNGKHEPQHRSQEDGSRYNSRYRALSLCQEKWTLLVDEDYLF